MRINRVDRRRAGSVAYLQSHFANLLLFGVQTDPTFAAAVARVSAPISIAWRTTSGHELCAVEGRALPAYPNPIHRKRRVLADCRARNVVARARARGAGAQPALTSEAWTRCTPAFFMSAQAFATEPLMSIPRQASSTTKAWKPSLRASSADQATQ
jgi:hypothetical protein